MAGAAGTRYYPKWDGPGEIRAVKRIRHRARTDLLYLAREILGYDKVSEEVHRPMVSTLAQFGDIQGNDRVQAANSTARSFSKYEPLAQDPADVLPKPLIDDPTTFRNVLILDPRGWFKCHRITDEKNIRLASGEYVSVKDLHISDTLDSLSDEYEPQPCRITGIEKQPPQPVYRLRFRSGRTLEVSGNHPIRQLDCWTPAADLKPGDRCAVLGHAPEPENAPELPHAEIVGWILGDGSMSNQVVTNENPQFRKEVIESATRAGGTAHEVHFPARTSGVRLQGLRPLFRHLGLFETVSGDKFVPAEMFRGDNASISRLLYGLFMSDGTAADNKIRYTSKSRRLCTDIQRLLLRFNVWSKVVKSHNHKYNTDYYHTEVTSSPEVEKFLRIFEWQKPNKFLPSQKPNPNFNTVPKAWRDRFGKTLFQRGTRPANLSSNKSYRKYDISKPRLKELAATLDDQVLKNLATDNVYWDHIEKVEFLGNEETLAIETSTGNYAIADVVTHNTTLNCVAHSIQILLNFPSTSIHIVHANGEISQEIVGSIIKEHFISNTKMRYAFPEFCSTVDTKGSFKDFGTKSQFTSPARQQFFGAPSVSAGSIVSTSAGKHFHWIKFTDIVTEQNCLTGDQLKKTAQIFHMYHNLLLAPHYFIDVEGTCYDYDDVYNKYIIERQLGLDDEDRSYRMFVRGCFHKIIPEGATETYFPDERDWPFLMRCPEHPTSEGATEDCLVEGCTKKRAPVSRFEEWNSTRFLLEKRNQDEWMFARQQLNDPSKTTGDDHPFPKSLMVWVPKKALDQLNFRFFSLSVDTAEAITKRSDFTAITVVGWSDQNRGYVVDGVQGRFLPEQMLEYVFTMYRKWRCTECRIEKASYNRGLMPAWREKQAREQARINLVWLERDTRTSKEARIMALQPFFKSGDLRFSRGLNPYVQEQFEKQFERFGGGGHDDLIDALADQFQNRTLSLAERPRSEKDIMAAANKAMIDRAMQKQAIYGPEHYIRNHTGAL